MRLRAASRIPIPSGAEAKMADHAGRAIGGAMRRDGLIRGFNASVIKTPYAKKGVQGRMAMY